jgi:hypothetical protein
MDTIRNNISKKTLNTYIKTSIVFIIITTLSLNSSVFAQDDGARAYWNAREKTNIFSFQYLVMSLDASDTKVFAPGQYIYGGADVDANISFGTYAHQFAFLKRPSSIAVNVIGGSVDANFNSSISPELLPPGVDPDTAFSQSSSGFGDPSVAFSTNLIGTPRLKSTVDLLNYEPGFSMDLGLLVSVPVGAYDNDKLVNLGLNRWFGRVALPMKYHFGVFATGYKSSFEITPSVSLFGDNDDFNAGQTLKNDPIWQIESHLTHDFAQNFYGSIDVLYQNGFQSELDGVETGDKLEIGSLGFSMNYLIQHNIMIRGGYSSNVFGNDNLNTSVVKLQFVYMWNQTEVNAKKLQGGE